MYTVYYIWPSFSRPTQVIIVICVYLECSWAGCFCESNLGCFINETNNMNVLSCPFCWVSFRIMPMAAYGMFVVSAMMYCNYLIYVLNWSHVQPCVLRVHSSSTKMIFRPTRTWVVIGGADKGGILVRHGEELWLGRRNGREVAFPEFGFNMSSFRGATFSASEKTWKNTSRFGRKEWHNDMHWWPPKRIGMFSGPKGKPKDHSIDLFTNREWWYFFSSTMLWCPKSLTWTSSHGVWS